MRKIDALLNEYGESHQNETNKLVHWIAVPMIAWTVHALLWSLPSPFGNPWINWCTIAIGAALIYYLYLSPALALAMFAFSAICIWLIKIYSFSWPLWQFALGVFIIAWIGQFWGHKVEGKKPSFFKDVQFLLIGPAWLFSFLFKKFRISY